MAELPFMLPYYWILLVVFAALVIAAIIVVVWWQAGRGQSGRDTRETPLDILKARYARGEITREDFEQMRKDLE
jgi:putative membrane protein